MRPLSRALEAVGFDGEKIETLGGRVGPLEDAEAELLSLASFVDDMFLG